MFVIYLITTFIPKCHLQTVLYTQASVVLVNIRTQTTQYSLFLMISVWRWPTAHLHTSHDTGFHLKLIFKKNVWIHSFIPFFLNKHWIKYTVNSQIVAFIYLDCRDNQTFMLTEILINCIQYFFRSFSASRHQGNSISLHFPGLMGKHLFHVQQLSTEQKGSELTVN